MGKGDQRSRRGKIWRGTNGKTRPKKRKPVPPAKG
jgi:30S ribosomal protein S31